MCNYFLYILKLGLLLSLFFNTVQSKILSRSLTKGWNLVSIPTNSPVECREYLVDKGILDSVEKIWGYSNTWQKFDPNLSSNTLSHFKPTLGYWIKTSKPVSFTFDNEKLNIFSVTVPRSGWILSNFNQAENLDIQTEVITDDTVDSSHSVDNISKIWGFDGSWRKYVNDGSGGLKNLSPAFAYWFKFIEVGDENISSSNPLTISPGIGLSETAFVLGGKTTLVPPNRSQFQETSPLLFRSTKSSYLETYSKNSLISPNYTLNTLSSTCDESSNDPAVIGYSFAYSLDGELLNRAIPSPVYCSTDVSNPVTYQIKLSKHEVLYLKGQVDKASNIIVKVQLNSGQCEKSIIKDRILSNSELAKLSKTSSIATVFDLDNDVSSSSTLIVNLLSNEISTRLKLNPDQFLLGEDYSGLLNHLSSVYVHINNSVYSKVDLEGLSSKLVTNIESESDPLKKLVKVFNTINDPNRLQDSTRIVSKSREFSRVINGISVDSEDENFQQSLSNVIQTMHTSNNILAIKKKLIDTGLITTEDIATIDRVIAELLKLDSQYPNLIVLSELVSSVLTIMYETKDDSYVNSLVKLKFDKLFKTLSSKSIDEFVDDNLIIKLAFDSLIYPKEFVGKLVNYDRVSEQIGTIYGIALVTLEKLKLQDEKHIDRSNKSLFINNEFKSENDNARNLFTGLITGLNDNDTIIGMLSGFLQSVSTPKYNTSLHKEFIDLKSVLSNKHILDLNLAKVLDSIVKPTTQKLIAAKMLCMVATSISEEKKILKTLSKLSNQESFKSLVSDAELITKYDHNNQIYANAGSNQSVFNSSTKDVIKLNANRSTDLLGRQLLFEWYQIKGVEKFSINSIGKSTDSSIVITNSINGSGILQFMVEVSDAYNPSKIDHDYVNIEFVNELFPIAIVPKSVTFNLAGESTSGVISIDASKSYVPNSKELLTYDWQIDNDSCKTTGPTTGSILELSCVKVGNYSLALTVNSLNKSTQTTIVLQVINEFAIDADVGQDLTFNVEKIKLEGGVLLENYSLNKYGEDLNTLEYEWSPKEYFSLDEDKSYKSKYPLFISTSIKAHKIQLKVLNQSNDVSYDNLEIKVVDKVAPISDAGVDQLIDLSTSQTRIMLNGQGSYSYTTETLIYKWTGSEGIIDSSSMVASIILTPEMFRENTDVTYTLTVSDSNGSSVDNTKIEISKDDNLPNIIVQKTPNVAYYKPGQKVILDAISSYSKNSLISNYQWKPLNFGLEGSTASSLILTIPSIDAQGTVKLKLVVTDFIGMSNEKIIELKVGGKKSNFRANVYPKLVSLDMESANISKAKCFNLSGNHKNLAYRWDIDSQYISIKSGIITSSEISFQLIRPLDIDLQLKCTVRDLTNNVSSSDFITLKQLGKSIDLEDININASINEMGNSKINETDYVKVSGFVYGTQSRLDSSKLTASLYVLDSGLKNRVSEVENAISFIETKIVGEAFSFDFSMTPLLSNNYEVVVTFQNDNSDKTTEKSLRFEVLPENGIELPLASTKILSLESKSMGKMMVETSYFNGYFIDDNIQFVLSGASNQLNRESLVYKWNYEWLDKKNTDTGNPKIFLIGNESPIVNFSFPNSYHERVLKVTLVVFDSLTNKYSLPSSVKITLSKREVASPLAKISTMPAGLADGDHRLYILDGRESINPAGNHLAFQWSYMSNDSEVFKSSINDETVEVSLPIGSHRFGLVCKDVISNMTSKIVYKDIQVLKHSLDYEFSYYLNSREMSIPENSKINDKFHIKNFIRVFSSTLDVDNRFIKQKVVVKDQNGNIAFTSVDEGNLLSKDIDLAQEGYYNLEISSWYDLNDDNLYSIQDKSELYSYNSLFKVEARLLPLSLEVEHYKYSSQDRIRMLVNNLNVNHEWLYNFEYQVVNKDENVQFNRAQSNAYSGITTNWSTGFPRDLSVGDYYISVDASATSSNYELTTSVLKEFTITSESVPTGLTATLNNHNIQVNWNKPEGIRYYTAIISPNTGFNSGGRRYNLDKNEILTTWGVGYNEDYYIKVASILNGKTLTYTPIVHLRTPPSTPTNLEINFQNNLPVLSWQPVTGRVDYIVYYSLDSSFPETNTVKLKRLSPNYTLPNLHLDKTYYFAVQSNNNHHKSQLSQTLNHSTSAPTPPENLTLLSENGVIQLDWDIDNKYTDYSVFYSNQANLEDKKIVSINSEVNSFLLDVSEANKDYYFAVKSHNIYGDSVLSQVVTTKTRFYKPVDLSYDKSSFEYYDNKLYILDKAHSNVHIKLGESNQYLKPIKITSYTRQMAIDSKLNKLYTINRYGNIDRFDLSNYQKSEDLLRVSNEPLSLEVLENKIIVNYYDFQSKPMVSFVDTANYSKVENEIGGSRFAISKESKMGYFYYDSKLYQARLNTDSNNLTVTEEFNLDEENQNSPKIFPSNDGKSILLDSGEIYFVGSKYSYKSLGYSIADVVWFEGGLLTIRTNQSNQTILEKWDSSLRLNDSKTFEGEALRIFPNDNSFKIVTRLSEGPYLFDYHIIEDSDSDGVRDIDDKFPTDAAASIDSDNDGYPDSWNQGYQQADSTSNLTLDVYPTDSGCFDASHTTLNVCDPSLSIPDFEPVKTLSDGEIVYLLSPENKRIYRWSSLNESFLNPLIVDENSIDFSMSNNLDKLYIVTSYGPIYEIDVSKENGPTSVISTAKTNFLSICTMNNFLYLTKSDGIDVSYSLTSQRYNSMVNNNTSKVICNYNKAYRLIDAHNDYLSYTEVNVRTGEIVHGNHSDLTYRRDYHSPIKFSDDDKWIGIANGDILSQSDLLPSHALPDDYIDLLWIEGQMVTIRSKDNGSAILEQWDGNFKLVNKVNLAGSPIQLLDGTSQVIIRYQSDLKPNLGIYEFTTDSDKDGVDYIHDKFPDDPAASIDSDDDGFPDEWNDGYTAEDTISNLKLDSFPNESACQTIDHAINGTCNIDSLTPHFEPDTITFDGEVLYFLDSANQKLYRWSSKFNSFLTPINVGVELYFVVYSKNHNRIYLGYSEGQINYLDLDGATVEQNYVNLNAPINGIQSAGNFLFVSAYSERGNNYYTYAKDGSQSHYTTGGIVSWDYTWNNMHSILYSFRFEGNLTVMQKRGVDQLTGRFTVNGNTPSFGKEIDKFFPIRFSLDSSKVLFGTGDIYQVGDYKQIETLGNYLVDAVWYEKGLISIHETEDSNTLYVQWDNNLNVYKAQDIPGAPMQIHKTEDSFLVVGQLSGRPVFTTVTHTDDGDGDGILNWGDAYPLDPAASIDNDKDGWPDRWNDGYTQSQSLDELQLDAFPNDSACQSSSHGMNGVCNKQATIPIYTPQSVVFGNEIIYSLDVDNNRIRRWSFTQKSYLNPLVIGNNSKFMTYSLNSNRIYLSYESGIVNYIDIDTGAIEFFFTKLEKEITGLQALTNHILIVHKQDTFNYTHAIFTQEGSRVFSHNYLRQSEDYAWEGFSNKLFFLKKGQEYSEILMSTIDPVTGHPTNPVVISYKHSEAEQSPKGIVLAGDEPLVLASNGGLYDTVLKRQLEVLPNPQVDGAFYNKGLVTIHAGEDGTTQLVQWNRKLRKFATKTFDGTPIKVFNKGDSFVVMTSVSDKPKYSIYEHTDDGDLDEVINSLDAFPLDVAASIDTDKDGYPDAWNVGYSSPDSTTGLAIDVFPIDSHCQTSEHEKDGNCDYLQGVPDYVPTDITFDGNIVYLLSKENNKVYRWSYNDSYHLNSIDVIKNTEKIALSSYYNKLYSVNSFGAISKIALTPNANPDIIVDLEDGPKVFKTINKFLLVSGQKHGLTVFDTTGTIKSALPYDHNVRDYSISAGNHRIYAHDFNYTKANELDLDTGTIKAVSDIQFGSYEAYTKPFTFSPDGLFVINSKGKVYDSDGFTYVDKLLIDSTIESSVWAPHSLVSLRRTNDDKTVLEFWDNSFKLINIKSFEGTPLRVFNTNDTYIIITLVNGKPAFSTYVNNFDGDNDGVTFLNDKFPLDIAASADTDNDGWPDTWNPGHSFSSSGLQLDYYPEDSSCQEQVSNENICPIESRESILEINNVDFDGEVVYLTGKDQNKILRWDMINQKYLNPIIVKDVPQLISYSKELNTLYISYKHGEITQINLDKSLTEHNFTTLQEAPKSLITIGSLVTASFYQYRDRRTIWDKDGDYVQKAKGRGNTYDSIWDPVTSRMYGLNSQHLVYDEIDLVSGEIIAAKASESNYTINDTTLVRSSINGEQVVLGNGDVYNTGDLTLAHQFNFTVIDAQWFEDGLITIQQTDLNQTKLVLWGHEFEELSIKLYEGTPVRLLKKNNKFVVITQIGNQAKLSILNYSNDEDSDGVLNDKDAFPTDPAASQDSDKDGWPDKWNDGYSVVDSTTGLQLDFFPLDTACQISTHSRNGICDVLFGIPSYVPTQMAFDGDIVYSLSEENNKIFRWSLSQKYHLGPILTKDSPNLITYSEVNHSLYVSYPLGEIRRIDLNNIVGDELFVKLEKKANGLIATPNFLLTSDRSGYLGMNYAYSYEGVQLASRERDKFFHNAAWNQVYGNLQSVSGNQPALDVDYFDKNNGKYISSDGSRKNGEWISFPSINISDDGEKTIVATGYIYDKEIDLIGKIGHTIVDAVWFNDELITIHKDGKTKLIQWGANLEVYNERLFDRDPIALFKKNNVVIVVTQGSQGPIFDTHVITGDGDSDGVADIEDKFPNDIAASIDTDDDGWPDRWNADFSSEDSTTSLTLDVYPNNFSCQLQSHGTGGVCDIVNGIPDYIPTKVETAGDIIYLLSQENSRIYRWSKSQNYHLESLKLDKDAQDILYMESHNALYIVYQSGKIEKISLSEGITRNSFVKLEETDKPTYGLQFTLQKLDKLMLIHINNKKNSIFNSAGFLVKRDTYYSHSVAYEWSPNDKRLYHFPQDYYPTEIMYKTMSLQTGETLDTGRSPHNANYYTKPLIRVSLDGSKVLAGTGDIYDQRKFTIVDSLESEVADALWNEEGLISIQKDGESGTKITQWSHRYEKLHSISVEGTPLRIFKIVDKHVIVTMYANKPRFSIY